MAPILVPEINGAVMADLGWLAAPKSRDTLPDLELPESLSLSGLIKSDALDAYTLAPDAIGTQWPQRIQSPASALKAEYGFALAPLILYADSETLATLPQTYRPVVMPPEKHRAYAVQWFLLALACLSVFLFASYQRPDKADTQSLEVS